MYAPRLRIIHYYVRTDHGTKKNIFAAYSMKLSKLGKFGDNFKLVLF
jgi:hypothetical protein